MSTLPPAPSDQPEDVYVARVLFAADRGLDPHEVSEQDALPFLDHARAWLVVRDASENWRAHDADRRADLARAMSTGPTDEPAAFRMYREMMRERDDARADTRAMREQRNAARGQLMGAEQQLRDAADELEALKGRHAATVSELEQARRDLVPVDQLRGALAAATGTIAELRPQRDDAEQRAIAAERKMNDALTEASTVQHTLAMVRRQAGTILGTIDYDKTHPVVDPS